MEVISGEDKLCEWVDFGPNYKITTFKLCDLWVTSFNDLHLSFLSHKIGSNSSYLIVLRIK